LARVPRLNKTIIEQRVDPGAIGRAGQGARAVAGSAEQELTRRENANALQEQTELVKRGAEFQNRAFDVVGENRERFSSNPQEGIKELDKSLRSLSKDFSGGLSAEGSASFNRSQEAALGRFGLQQRKWAVGQAESNVQDNVNA